ncbi:MAG TPA: hypothetical protein VLJ59_15095 [Mycobacteriales bacterium]|nr:hypothetical protein [Mycobacteriales bacterium]
MNGVVGWVVAIAAVAMILGMVIGAHLARPTRDRDPGPGSAQDFLAILAMILRTSISGNELENDGEEARPKGKRRRPP